MLVDPDMARILAVMKAAPAEDLSALPITEARALFEVQQTPWAWCDVAMAETREMTVPGAAGPLRARLHRPVAAKGLPVILFLHGGGWTFGSIDTHGGTMRMIAARSGCAVLGIDYRLAPECPFPGPMEDALSALAFIEAGGLGDDVDASRIALAGDSAGANLALGALLTRRDRGERMPATAVLIYGCYAPLFDTASHKRLGDGTFNMRTEMMRWYWANFLGPHASAPPPAAAPLDADLTGLPPLYLNAAGLDPLVDDTTLLVDRLTTAGVRHRFDLWPGVVHGFVRLARELPMARRAVAAGGDWLREILHD
jgi:acetyl esterase